MSSLEPRIIFQAVVWRTDLRGKPEETGRGERLCWDGNRMGGVSISPVSWLWRAVPALSDPSACALAGACEYATDTCI